MNKDYYSVLGVARDATEDEIKKAYRRLAAKHHPDRGGSKEQFQQIEEAYRVLSDPVQRQRADQPQNPFGENFGGFPGGFNFNFGGGGSPFDDFFNGVFRGQQGRQPGQQVYRTTVFVTLEQVFSGGQQSLRFQTTRGTHAVQIDIPRGVGDGMQLRYDNLIPDGPLIVEFRTHPHLKFQRVGNDIHTNIRVSTLDLLTGSAIEFTGLDGRTLQVNIPKFTQPSAALKISGEGLPVMNSSHRGDVYLNIKAFTPDTVAEEIIQLINKHKGQL